MRFDKRGSRGSATPLASGDCETNRMLAKILTKKAKKNYRKDCEIFNNVIQYRYAKSSLACNFERSRHT